jgi:hypothetical protein
MHYYSFACWINTLLADYVSMNVKEQTHKNKQKANK